MTKFNTPSDPDAYRDPAGMGDDLPFQHQTPEWYENAHWRELEDLACKGDRKADAELEARQSYLDADLG